MPHLTRITVVFTGPAIAAWRRQQILERTKAVVHADREANPCYAWVMSDIDRALKNFSEQHWWFPRFPGSFRVRYRWTRVR